MPRRGRRPGKYSQATRVLLLLERLRGRTGGAPLAELADDLGVTPRQLRRDVAAIVDAGHGVESRPASDGRTRVRLTDASSRGVHLSLRERYALLAVQRVFDVLHDTPFHEDVENIVTKVSASLPAKERAELAAFGERIVYVPDGGTKIYRGKDDVLDALFTATIYRWRLQYRYASPGPGESREGLLEPYAIVLYKHGLYVIGRPVDEAKAGGRRRAVRPLVWAAERFEEADYVREAKFEVPKGFRADRFFQGAFGLWVGGETRHVVVEFTREVRSLVEARTWHPSQSLRPLADGGVRLELDVENLTYVVPWVLSWGPHALVRAPAELVARVSDEVHRAARRYPPPGAPPARPVRVVS